MADQLADQMTRRMMKKTTYGLRITNYELLNYNLTIVPVAVTKQDNGEISSSLIPKTIAVEITADPTAIFAVSRATVSINVVIKFPRTVLPIPRIVLIAWEFRMSQTTNRAEQTVIPLKP